MFLIAPMHCFYLLLFGFLLSTTTVLTTSTAHTCTYTAVRYCSITELALLLDKDEDEDLGRKLFSVSCLLLTLVLQHAQCTLTVLLWRALLSNFRDAIERAQCGNILKNRPTKGKVNVWSRMRKGGYVAI